MNVWQYILVAVTGLAAGILSGLFGVGGGTLIIPALVFILGFSQQKAQGTSLATLLLPVGILGVIRYWKAGDVDWIAGLILAGGLLLGAYFGAGWAIKLNEVWLKRAFGIFFILLGIRYILTKSAP
jgi:uncharacterized membrane protein YfcA